MNTNYQYTAQDYVEAIRRRRRTLLLVAGPILGIALLVALLLPSTYTSRAMIDIDLEGSGLQTLQPIELTRFAEQYLNKLEERVLSYDGLAPLAELLKTQFEQYQNLPDTDLHDTVFEQIEIKLVTQPVMSQNFGREVDLISGFEVVSVGQDPHAVYAIVDYVATRFLEADRLSRTERASSTTSFLREQMGETEDEIVELERNIANFKVENACCLPELMDLNLSAIERAERDIEIIQPRIVTLEKERLFYETQLDEIRQQSTSTDRLAELEKEYLRLVANYGAEHPDVARIRREIGVITNAAPTSGESQELLELRAELESAEQRYMPEHPNVLRLKREIAALEAQQGEQRNSDNRMRVDNPRYIQLRTQLNSVDAELAELRARAPELRQRIEEYEGRLRKTPLIESQYHALNRDLETARLNFDDMQKRLAIARQTEALESTDFGARLAQVQAAETPDEPSGPPRVAIVIVGVFLAFSFGFGAILGAEATDSTLRSSRDVESILNIVPLASIPIINNQQRVAAHRRQVIVVSAASILLIGTVVVYFMTRLA